MAGFTDYQSDEPILQVQPIESSGEGNEAFASYLKSVGQTGMQVATRMESNLSKASLSSSMTNLNELKDQSNIMMLQHPNQAASIAKNMDETAQSLVNNTSVNAGDRIALNKFANTQIQSMNFDAAKNQIQQTRIQSAMTFDTQFKPMMNNLQQMAISNSPQLKDFQSGIVNQINGLVQSRSLTPKQGSGYLQTIGSVLDGAKQYHDAFSNPDSTAQDYHAVKSNPFNKNNDTSNDPMHGDTAWHVANNENSATFNDCVNDIDKGVLPSGQGFVNLTPNQRSQLIVRYQGIKNAQGYINSGQPFQAIQSRFKQLDQKFANLNYAEQGERNYLGNYINQLKSGNMNSAIANVPAASNASLVYNQTVQANNAMRQSALKNVNDPANQAQINAQYDQANIKAKNQFVTTMASVGNAQHIPSAYIQPIPKSDISTAESSFSTNGDPNQLLNVLGQYNNQNKMYVANGLKKPLWQVVAHNVAISNSLSPEQKLGYIAANQSGVSYSAIAQQKGVNDGTLKVAVSNNLTDTFSAIRQMYDPQTANIRIQEDMQSTMNYAKYLAMQNNDLQPSSWSKYAAEASQVVQAANPILSGNNYIVNKNYVPVNISQPQISKLMNYAVSRAQATTGQNVDPYAYSLASARNPLMATMSPTGSVIVRDKGGQIYYSAPFSMKLMAAAEKFHVEQTQTNPEERAQELSLQQQFKNLRPENGNS